MHQTILITGAAQRIGKEIAIFFAKKGWNIVLHFNKSKKNALLVQKQIHKIGAKCLIIKADLSKFSDLKKIFSVSNQKMGVVNCLINCASVFENDNIEKFNQKKWQAHFDINLKAPAILSSYFSKQKKIKNGNIINIIDQRIFKLTPYFLSYTLSKAGLHTLTKVLAMRFAPKIRVNAIAPGPVMRNHRQSKLHFKKQFKNTLLQKKVEISDICNSIEFIINNKSTTGHRIPIDSGQSMAWQTPDLINIKE